MPAQLWKTTVGGHVGLFLIDKKQLWIEHSSNTLEKMARLFYYISQDTFFSFRLRRFSKTFKIFFRAL